MFSEGKVLVDGRKKEKMGDECETPFPTRNQTDQFWGGRGRAKSISKKSENTKGPKSNYQQNECVPLGGEESVNQKASGTMEL